MIGLLIALVSLFTFSASSVFMKRPIRQVGVFSALLLNYVFTAVLTLAAVLAFDKLVLPSQEIVWLLFFEIVVGAVGIVAYFKANEEGELSIVSPVAKLSVIITLFISLVFFNEVFGLWQAVGAAMIIGSATVIAIQKGKVKRLEKGILYAVLTGIGWGIFFAVLKPLTAALGPFNTAFFTETGILAVILLFVLLTKKSIAFTQRAAKSMFAKAVLATVGVITYNIAISLIGAALSASILAASPALLVLFSKAYLKEKIARYKYFAIAGIVLGLAVLALG